MMKAEVDPPPSKFILQHTLSPSNAYKKGLALLCVSTFGVFMLLLCYFRVIFSDPGYVPGPLELEYQIIQKNRQSPEKEEGSLSYLTKFDYVMQEGPLTNNEGLQIREKVSTHFQEIRINEYGSLGNEDIILINKKKYEEETKDNKNDNLTTFLKVYKGFDLTMAHLCGVCLRLKVERSHHCRQCGKCVLKMDHHCPWLGNCIGFRNYKSFCLLHFYGVLSTFIIFATYWEVIVNYNINLQLEMVNVCCTLFIYISNLGLMMFLIWLFYVNCGLIFSNQTIIEQSDRERFPSTKGVNIYDMGKYRNFTNVFGRNPLVWFIPFFPNLNGDGFVFESNGFKFDSK